MMSSDGLATHWIDRLGSGHAAAAPARRERYFRQRVGLARKKVQDMPGRAVDQEDVALSAFEGFCRSAERGRYPQRRDRDMRLAVTVRKMFDLGRDERRHERGGFPASRRRRAGHEPCRMA